MPSNSLRHNDQQRGQVLRVQDEVFLLHQIGQVADQQTSAERRRAQTNKTYQMMYSRNVCCNHPSDLRLLLLQILQIALQIVVGIRFGLQIGIDLAHLLRDDVGDVAQRLLDRILGHVPLEARYIRRQIGCGFFCGFRFGAQIIT